MLHKIILLDTVSLLQINSNIAFQYILVSQRVCFVSMEEKLIEEVRRHQCLFDVSKKFYRDQKMRFEAWSEIAAVLNMNGKYAFLFKTFV